MHYHRKREWAIPERHATPEAVFFNRRAFLQGSVGAVAGGIVGMSSLAAVAEAKEHKVQDPTFDLYPAQQNPAFTLDHGSYTALANPHGLYAIHCRAASISPLPSHLPSRASWCSGLEQRSEHEKD